MTSFFQRLQIRRWKKLLKTKILKVREGQTIIKSKLVKYSQGQRIYNY
jgi:hypothetical protein